MKTIARSSISDLWDMWRALAIETILWLVIVGGAVFVLGLVALRAERATWLSSASEPDKEILGTAQNFSWASWGALAAAIAFGLWMGRWEAGVFAYLVNGVAWGMEADVCYALGHFTNDIVKVLKETQA